MSAALLLLLALPLLGCTETALVQVRYDVRQVPSSAAAACELIPPKGMGGGSTQHTKVCVWVNGALNPYGETEHRHWNNFVEGPATVDVYVDGDNPFCKTFDASMNSVAAAPPSPLPGAISGAPAVVVSAVAAAAPPPLGKSLSMEAPVDIFESAVEQVNPLDGSGTNLVQILKKATARLHSDEELLAKLKHDIIDTAAQIHAISTNCNNMSKQINDATAFLVDSVTTKKKRDALAGQFSDLSRAVGDDQGMLRGAADMARSYEASAYEAKAPAQKPHPGKAAKMLRGYADALLAHATSLQTELDAIQSGTKTQSLPTVLKDLDTLEKANKAAKETLDAQNHNEAKLLRSQTFPANQAVSVDLVDKSSGSAVPDPKGEQKITFQTLSPLYLDIGLGPVINVTPTRSYTVAAAPGAMLGRVTHSDAINMDGMLSLSGYFWGRRYYDGSLRFHAKQLIPRPMIGLSAKALLSSIYLGAQIDPIQFLDIGFGAYIYSKPELVAAKDGALVPTGSLATANVPTATFFVSITSSVNLFANWIGTVAKSPTP